MNKQFADIWRPQLGAGGVTMDGIGWLVFLTDLDYGEQKADVQLALLSRALVVASKSNRRSVFPDAGSFALCFRQCVRRDNKQSNVF